MANTFIQVAKITVGSGGAATIDFTSIPQTYTDLILIHSMRTSRSAIHESLKLSFNGSTASQLNKRIYGTGGSGTGDTLMYGGQAAGATATASIYGNSTVYIPNYTSANNKSSGEEAVSGNNSAGSLLTINANLWSNTAAINQITLTPENGGTIQQYSTATLYGIKKN